MDIEERVSKAFERSSAVLCLVIGLTFLVMILSTSYYVLIYKEDPGAFLQEPGVKRYENTIENVVGKMGGLERTEYYWSHNLGTAGLFIAGTPMYLSFYSLIFGGHSVGTALSYWYYKGALLAFLATVFVHGVFELTGFFSVAAITLLAAWALWKALGHMMAVKHKERDLEWWRPSRKWRKIWLREIRRYRDDISEFLFDFGSLVAVGAFLIFIAAPVEAYISPWAFTCFKEMPILAIVFLVAVAFFYFSLFIRGLGAARENAGATYKDIKLALKRRWRPAQLPFLIFVTISTITLVIYLAQL